MDKTARNLSPLRIAVIYACLGGLWILFSDALFGALFKDPTILARLSIFKGWLFILVTAAILYMLVSRLTGGLQESTLGIESIFESITDAFVALDRDWRYTYVNEKAARIFGRRREDLIGKHIWTEFPEGIGQPFYHAYHRAVKDQTPIQIEEYYPPYSRWFENRIYPSRHGLAIFFQDITERKWAEKELQEHEEWFRAIASSTPDHILMQDRELRYRFVVNPQLGLTEQDMIGKTDYDLLSQEEADKLTKVKRQVMETGEAFYFETSLLSRDGKEEFFDGTYVPRFHAQGKIAGLIGYFRNVTDQKKAEEALQRNEQVLRLFVENPPAEIGGIILFSEVITEHKKAEERILRLSRLYSVLSRINEVIIRIREPEELYRQTCKIIVEDGFFRMAWIGLVDHDTLLVKPVAIYGHEDGYLPEKRISIDERIPEGRGPTGTAIREGGYFVCNDIANDPVMAPWREEALKRGYRASAAFALKVGGEIIGTLNIYSGTAYFFQEEVLLLRALADDISYAVEAMEIEKQRLHAEAALRELATGLEERVAVRTQELRESRGALVNLVEDLNEKSHELEAANVRLREMDRLKSMFIASMSHELRTPLNSVIGFSSIILNEWVGPLNDEQKENLATVLRSGRHLLSLINDVIDVSKIEAGQIEAVLSEFDLSEVIGEAVASLEKDIKAKNLGLVVANLHQPMHSDRRRLLQCLLNLMSNAMKYTEKGSVTLRAQKVNRNLVEISVEDTGIGIGEGDREKIFHAFTRLDSPLKSLVPDTGLGLYLTRKLVHEVLHGEINFTSELGKGSRFAISMLVNSKQ